jgi:MoxR-like ATPase
MKYIFKNGKSFEYLMGRYSTPDEIFGPVSISKLKQDEYERILSGYLPDSEIVFLDEIWKASPAIQNSLLTAINERIYRNGTKEIKIPLKLLIAASNELPQKDLGLEALWDRFIIRVIVKNIKKHGNFEKLIDNDNEDDVYRDILPEELKFTEKEYNSIQEEIKKIIIPKNIKNIIIIIRNEFNYSNIHVSDRRWKKIIKILKTSAYINGREQIDYKDLILIPYCSWNKKEDRKKVEDIVKKVLFRILRIKIKKIELIKKRFLDEAKQLKNEINDINREINDLIGNFRENISEIKNLIEKFIKNIKKLYSILDSPNFQFNLLINEILRNTEDVKKNDSILSQSKEIKVEICRVNNSTERDDCCLILFYKMMVWIIYYYYEQNPNYYYKQNPTHKVKFWDYLKHNKSLKFFKNKPNIRVEEEYSKKYIDFKDIQSINLTVQGDYQRIEIHCSRGYMNLYTQDDFKTIKFFFRYDEYYSKFKKIEQIDNLINMLYESKVPSSESKQYIEDVLKIDNVDNIIQKLKEIIETFLSKNLPNLIDKIAQKLIENVKENVKEIEEKKIENISSMISKIKNKIDNYQKKLNEFQLKRNEFNTNLTNNLNDLKKEINLLSEPPLSYLNLAKKLEKDLKKEVQNIEEEIKEILKNI